MGEKKFMPINFSITYKLKYFKKGISLNKKYIISKMLRNPAYALYTPDNTNIEKLSREFLLTLVDRALYKSFYSIYKEKTMQIKFNKWNNYSIDIKSDILQKLKQFIPIDANNSTSRSFKLTKNHLPTYSFKESIHRKNNSVNSLYQNNTDKNQKKTINISIKTLTKNQSNLSGKINNSMNNPLNKIDASKKNDINEDKDIEMNNNYNK